MKVLTDSLSPTKQGSMFYVPGPSEPQVGEEGRAKEGSICSLGHIFFFVVAGF
jgi:hypothetical protein